MGLDPSQHPPDWWNSSGPCCPTSRLTNTSASGVMSTRVAPTA
jgi:hypothetical protein